MAVNQEYKEYRVNDLPETGYAGDRYYLNVGGGKFQTYIISDALTPVREAGQEFIECDTVDDLRNLDARQFWAIQSGYYKGVTLSGYYTKGDTPAPIQYYLSDTAESDNGGSVFEVGGIKLEHEFTDSVNVRYFGAKSEDESFDNRDVINKACLKSKRVIIDDGTYYVTIVTGGYGGAGGIMLQPDQVLEMGNNAVIQQSSSNVSVGNILGIRYDNITIRGGKIIGDKNNHVAPNGNVWKQRLPATNYSVGEYIYINTYGFIVDSAGLTGVTLPTYTGSEVGDSITDGSVIMTVVASPVSSSGLGERSHGLWIHNSENIIIEGTEFNECWGDGIYIGGDGATSKGGRNVSINNVKCISNRRQGLSAVHGSNIKITNSSFNYTSGTLPSAGIDLEPNDIGTTDYQKLENILIDSCEFLENAGSGIEVAVHTNRAIINGVTLSKNNLYNNRVDVVGRSSGSVRNVQVLNNQISLGNRDNALRFTRTNDSSAIGNTILEVGRTESRNIVGIIVRSNSKNIDIINNYISDFNGYGIRSEGDCTDLTIMGNNIQRTAQSGIRITSTIRFSISNNYITDITSGGILTGSSSEGVISNNILKLNNAYRVITLDDGTNFTVVSNNEIRSFRYAGIGIIGDSSNNTISNNILNAPDLSTFGIDLNSVNSGLINSLVSNFYIGNITTKQRVTPSTSLFPKMTFDSESRLGISESDSVSVNSLSLQSRQSPNVVVTGRAFIPFVNTSPDSSGFPSSAGGGIYYQRGQGNVDGSFTLYKPNGNSLELFLMNGVGEYLPFQLASSGSVRPTTGLFVGKTHFDTTLGFTITYNGTDWVDSTGTVV